MKQKSETTYRKKDTYIDQIDGQKTLVKIALQELSNHSTLQRTESHETPQTTQEHPKIITSVRKVTNSMAQHQ